MKKILIALFLIMTSCPVFAQTATPTATPTPTLTPTPTVAPEIWRRMFGDFDFAGHIRAATDIIGTAIYGIVSDATIADASYFADDNLEWMLGYLANRQNLLSASSDIHQASITALENLATVTPQELHPGQNIWLETPTPGGAGYIIHATDTIPTPPPTVILTPVGGISITKNGDNYFELEVPTEKPYATPVDTPTPMPTATPHEILAYSQDIGNGAESYLIVHDFNTSDIVVETRYNPSTAEPARIGRNAISSWHIPYASGGTEILSTTCVIVEFDPDVAPISNEVRVTVLAAGAKDEGEGGGSVNTPTPMNTATPLPTNMVQGNYVTPLPTYRFNVNVPTPVNTLAQPTPPPTVILTPIGGISISKNGTNSFDLTVPTERPYATPMPTKMVQGNYVTPISTYRFNVSVPTPVNTLVPPTAAALHAGENIWIYTPTPGGVAGYIINASGGPTPTPVNLSGYYQTDGGNREDAVGPQMNYNTNLDALNLRADRNLAVFLDPEEDSDDGAFALYNDMDLFFMAGPSLLWQFQAGASCGYDFYIGGTRKLYLTSSTTYWYNHLDLNSYDITDVDRITANELYSADLYYAKNPPIIAGDYLTKTIDGNGRAVLDVNPPPTATAVPTATPQTIPSTPTPIPSDKYVKRAGDNMESAGSGLDMNQTDLTDADVVEANKLRLINMDDTIENLLPYLQTGDILFAENGIGGIAHADLDIEKSGGELRLTITYSDSSTAQQTLEKYIARPENDWRVYFHHVAWDDNDDGIIGLDEVYMIQWQENS